MQTRLNLDPAVVREARALAAKAGQPIVEMARTHTTVSVERAVLRLAGLQGADPDWMPWVNRLADAVRETTGLEHGVALPACWMRCWPWRATTAWARLPRRPRRATQRSASRPVTPRRRRRAGPRRPR